jgi:hypothetical protein
MAYNTLVPTTGHSASQDYQAMQGNFAQIQNSFSVNHTPLASGGGTEGFHTKVQFPAVISDPGLASPQSSLYIKAVSGLSQLFFQNGALAANIVQLTGNAVLTASEYTIVTPWGLILKFGIGSASNAGDVNNFAVAFPNSGIGVMITPRHAGALSSAVTGPSTTQFTGWLQAGPGSQAVYYFAWGT